MILRMKLRPAPDGFRNLVHREIYMRGLNQLSREMTFRNVLPLNCLSNNQAQNIEQSLNADGFQNIGISLCFGPEDCICRANVI